jgi:acyl carrier protein
MEQAQVIGELERIAAEQLGVQRKLAPEDDLVRDLDLDSVQLITLAVAIEEHFRIALPSQMSARVCTVGDLCRIVLDALSRSK